MDDISSTWSEDTTRKSVETVRTLEPISEESLAIVERTCHFQDSDLSDARSPQLANWEIWLERRKKLHSNLCKKLQREPKCLTMNSEDVYEKMRNHLLIENAKAYVKFDRYRGDPKFWAVPDYLKDRETKENLVCCVKEKFDRTEVNKNKPATLEFIGIPKDIYNEKGINTEVVCDKGKKVYCKLGYINERVSELKDNIELIQDYIPNIDELIVVGRNYQDQHKIIQEKQEVIVPPKVPDISVSLGVSEDPDEAELLPALSINDTFIDRSIKKVKINLEFNNCKTDQVSTKVLIVENIGNCSVRYDWEFIDEKPNPEFPLVYSRQIRKRFFLNPVFNVFLPGKKVEIPVWFKSREPGVFNESWILRTDPLITGKRPIIVSLHAFVKKKTINTRYQEIESYIERNVATSEAHRIMSEICFLHSEDIDLDYRDLFTDREVFHHNNPGHFYDYELVKELTRLNKEISGLPWDFKIVTIRENILKSVLTLDQKKLHMDRLFQISKFLLRPQEAFDLSNEKYRSVYQILCALACKIHSDSLELKKIYELLIVPSLILKCDDDLNKLSKSSLKNLERVVERRVSRSRSKDSGKKPLVKKVSQTSIIQQGSKTEENQSSVKRPSASHRKSEVNVKQEVEKLQYVPPTPENESDRCKYIKALYTRTYYNLCSAVDKITAVLESQKLYEEITKS